MSQFKPLEAPAIREYPLDLVFHSHIWEEIAEFNCGDCLQVFRCDCGSTKYLSLKQGKVMILNNQPTMEVLSEIHL